MERFTKGPWHHDKKLSAVKNDDGYIICSGDSYGVPEITANISLIAAAPEMYDELVDSKTAFEFIVENSLVNAIYLPALHEQIESITAILAKARGEKLAQP